MDVAIHEQLIDTGDVWRYNPDMCRKVQRGVITMALADIAGLLGSESSFPTPIRNRLDLVALGDAGITKRMLLHLSENLGLSLNQMVELLPVTERTLQRYGPDKPFSRVLSEQILQIAEVLARGIEVFGAKQNFVAWLNQPNRVLGDRTPFSLMGSRFGAELILDELGRIEHGVFS